MKISYKKLWVLLMIDHSQNAREVAASTKRKEKLQKQLKECRDYDEMIAHLALSRIELDLDDGVQAMGSSMRCWQIPKILWLKRNKPEFLFSLYFYKQIGYNQ